MQIAEPGNIMSVDSAWSDDPGIIEACLALVVSPDSRPHPLFSSFSENLLKQVESGQEVGGEEKARYGPLTQRLISVSSVSNSWT